MNSCLSKSIRANVNVTFSVEIWNHLETFGRTCWFFLFNTLIPLSTLITGIPCMHLHIIYMHACMHAYLYICTYIQRFKMINSFILVIEQWTTKVISSFPSLWQHPHRYSLLSFSCILRKIWHLELPQKIPAIFIH